MIAARNDQSQINKTLAQAGPSMREGEHFGDGSASSNAAPGYRTTNHAKAPIDATGISPLGEPMW